MQAETVEFWRLPRVVEVTGLSKSEIYRRVREGTFPSSHSYPGGSARDTRRASVFWVSSEIRRWQAGVLGDEFAGLIG